MAAKKGYEKQQKAKTRAPKKQKKPKLPTFSFIGPHPPPHGNSPASPPLSDQQKKDKKRTQDRLAQRRKRARKKLLFPWHRLCTKEEMKTKGVKSWFAIHAGAYEYVLHLANWEIYSTKLGSIYRHGREVRDNNGINGPPCVPRQCDYKVDDDHWVEISEDVTQSLDTKHDLLHVTRKGSPILQKIARDPTMKDNAYKNGTLDINFSIIINGLMTKGVGIPDDVRSPNSFRINFGFNEFGTPTSFGRVNNLLGNNADAFKKEVGRVAELLCAAMQKMQVASGNGYIMTNDARDSGYAAKLRRRLGLYPSSPMRAEMIAVCTMKIFPTCPLNLPHRDLKNPVQPEYNRNGTFSAVVSDDNGHLHLLQVLVASRRYAVTLGQKGLY